MAHVLITIQDVVDEDGDEHADVEVDFDPAFPGAHPDDATTAQLVAIRMVEAAASRAELDNAKFTREEDE